MRFSGTHFRKVVFALILVGLSLLIFLRHRRIEEAGSLQWYDRPVIFLTAPVAGAVLSTREWMRHLVGRYIYLVRVEGENEELRKRMDEYKAQAVVARETENENGRLRQLLDLRTRMSGEWIAARVISYPPAGSYRILTVDKGTEAGIYARAPVISTEGLVGQVARVSPHQSEILLIIDPTSAVDARIEVDPPTNPATNARGLITGKVTKLAMDRNLFVGAFEYLNQSVWIEEGQKVVTSGMDGIYPPGILMGTICGKHKKKYDVFQQAEVAPAVDFFNLREVLILKTR